MLSPGRDPVSLCVGEGLLRGQITTQRKAKLVIGTLRGLKVMAVMLGSQNKPPLTGPMTTYTALGLEWSLVQSL